MTRKRRYQCQRCGGYGHQERTCTATPPLWWRAILARRQGQGGRRRHPVAQIGDSFGAVKVIALLPRDATSNERVRVRCRCGVERDAYVFNLRRRLDECRHSRTAIDAAAG